MPTPTALSTFVVTSNDKKGRKATDLFRAAYDKVGLDEEKAQRLNENPKFPAALLEAIRNFSISNQFAGEEVKSDYAYPSKYKGPKPIQEQIQALKVIFPHLNVTATLEFVQNVLPTLQLPAGSEGWFAIPRWQKVADNYNVAVEHVLAIIGSKRAFQNYREGELGSDRLRQHARTVAMLEQIGVGQGGDILVIPAQFGMRHRGRSVRRARECFFGNEFGLGSFAVACMLLTHSEREVEGKQLHSDCAGDEYAPGADGDFSSAPIFRFGDGWVEFGAVWFDDAVDLYGSSSAFLPQ
jgi:hypothetical protein